MFDHNNDTSCPNRCRETYDRAVLQNTDAVFVHRQPNVFALLRRGSDGLEEGESAQYRFVMGPQSDAEGRHNAEPPTHLCFKESGPKERPLPGNSQVDPDALGRTPTPEGGPAGGETLQQLSERRNIVLLGVTAKRGADQTPDLIPWLHDAVSCGGSQGLWWEWRVLLPELLLRWGPAVVFRIEPVQNLFQGLVRFGLS